MRYCWLIVLLGLLIGVEVTAQVRDTFTQPNLLFVAKPMFKKQNSLAYYENYFKEKAKFSSLDTIYGVLYAGPKHPYWISEDEKGKYIVVDYWIGEQTPIGIQYYLQPMTGADFKLPMVLDKLAAKLFKRSNFYYFRWAANPHIYDTNNKLSLYQMLYANYTREAVFDGMTWEYSLGGGIDQGSCFIDFSQGKGVYANILGIMEERESLRVQKDKATAEQAALAKAVAPLTLADFEEWLALRENAKEQTKEMEFELFKTQEAAKNIINTLPKDLTKQLKADFQTLYTIDMSIVSKDDLEQRADNLKRRQKLAAKLASNSLVTTHYQNYAKEADKLLSLDEKIKKQDQMVSERQYIFMRQMHKFKQLQRLHENLEAWDIRLKELH